MPVTEIWLDNGMNLSGFWRKPSEFFMIEAMPYALGGLDAIVGNPAPSFRNQGGAWSVRLAVKSGARTVSVDVRQPQVSAIRPRLRVRANPAIGLATDLEAVAGASTDWQTISVSFTATANGGVLVLLVNEDTVNPAWFDNVKVT